MKSPEEFIELTDPNHKERLEGTPYSNARHFQHPKSPWVKVMLVNQEEEWLVVVWTSWWRASSLREEYLPAICAKLPASGPRPVAVHAVSLPEFERYDYEHGFNILFDDSSTRHFDHPWFPSKPTWEFAPATRRQLEENMTKGERWKRFAGYLYTSDGFPDPPDEISRILAFRYGFTNRARYFRINKDGSVRLSGPKTGRLNLMVKGTRWQPSVKSLLNRMFGNEPGGPWLKPAESQQLPLPTEDDCKRAARIGWGRF